MSTGQPYARVLRSDGKYINLILKTGHLFVCKGCCCGHVERGHAPVPEALFHNEWERRKLRSRVHLTIGGCLGPCPLANVVMLNFAGTSLWFQSFNTDWQVLALYDYIESMLAANRLLPVPEALRPFVFNFYAWQARAMAEATDAVAPADKAVVSPIVVLSHADTDLLVVRRARVRLPADFPSVCARRWSRSARRRPWHSSSAMCCATRSLSWRGWRAASRTRPSCAASPSFVGRLTARCCASQPFSPTLSSTPSPSIRPSPVRPTPTCAAGQGDRCHFAAAKRQT